ncbi:MAG: chorismate synthase, partial [Treponema sp.]|nr:chorismate synthase [Treponema sp.]
TYEVKYGHRDYRGGGRASGRETASRVAAGAIAKKILSTFGTKTIAYTIKAAGITCEKRDLTVIEKNMIRACDLDAAKKMEEKIASLREHGDSSGGIIECVVQGVPHSLGEPVFDKLDALLAHALLSIGAIKGIEFGLGFEAADNLGSQNNDSPYVKDGNVQFLSNNDGGITGGISSGNDIVFRVAVKPVPSIFKTQNTIQKNDDGTFSNTTLAIKGRHDVCLCPRIVPVVEAMTNIVLVDMLLQNKCVRL